MAWDPKVQKRYKVQSGNGGYVEEGILAFATSGVTIEVPTKCKKIYAVHGVTIDGTGVALTENPPTITAGCVTLTRPSGGTSAAAFSYHLYGR